MEISLEQIMARVEERKQASITALASSDFPEAYRCQGEFRTLEWLLQLPEQIEAEREIERQRHDYADDV